MTGEAGYMCNAVDTPCTLTHGSRGGEDEVEDVDVGDKEDELEEGELEEEEEDEQ